MSELESISQNNEEKSKRSMSELIDISMAILNSIIIIIFFALIRNGILLLNIFGLILLTALFLGAIMTFLKKNPFYIIFCYGLTLCGVLGNFLDFIENPYFGIIFIFQGLYIYTIIPYDVLIEGRSSDLYSVKPSNYYIFQRKNQKQVSEEKRRQEFVDKHRKKTKKECKFNSIALISIGCSISLFLTLIISA